MRFAPSPRPWRGGPRWPNARRLAIALVVCCVLVVVASAFPWKRIAFERLWGAARGPRGLESEAGLTCLLSCTMTAMLVLFEGRSSSTREATRSACVALMLAAALAMAARLWQGPGFLRGVTAAHSIWFYAAAAAVLTGAVCGALRRRRPPPIAGRPAVD